MASYKLSGLAAEDLRLISIKTIEKWGRTQAQTYVSLLHNILLQMPIRLILAKAGLNCLKMPRAFRHKNIWFITGNHQKALRLPEYCINAWTF